ncbi:ABC-2 type transport system ATP-binding protein [Flavobacteriaceae bacterium UJ101]|nr:ABC-2 type transport system ATP-binding protein [Flavobacteriaceae bacterium UJ101]
MSIKVSNLSKIIEKQVVLNEISFEAKGIVALLGPNGAGKSSLMKILTTFSNKTSGEVIVSGIDVSKNPEEIKKKVGYLPEHNPLYLDLYVKEYLEYVAGIRKIPKSYVKDIVEKTSLSLEQHKKIKMLSKGYRQRVGLAQAMIHNPDVLILDEPTTGLDPNQILEIRNLIKNFGKDKTILISTHIMQEVEAICDQVLILNKGILLKNTSLEEIRQEYGSVEKAFYQLTNI